MESVIRSAPIPAEEMGTGIPSPCDREHMFDKVVTPSDVGKLNRLVIPKQHAEKYFPLDSSTNEKGLLLNFEDRNGKQWRFRYSYWNSSQSYVMTKGWSRFVKEKRLDAGDIVSFHRGRDRFFIDWRRRPGPPPAAIHNSLFYLQPHHNYVQYSGAVINGNPCHLPSPSAGSAMTTYLRSAPIAVGLGPGWGGPGPGSGSGSRTDQMVYESVPVVQGKAAAKRVRLFGVNLDCPISDSENGCDMNILSSSSPTLPHSSTTPFLHHLLPPFQSSSSSSSSSSSPSPHPNSIQLSHVYDKGKSTTSMSLDLDI